MSRCASRWTPQVESPTLTVCIVENSVAIRQNADDSPSSVTAHARGPAVARRPITGGSETPFPRAFPLLSSPAGSRALSRPLSSSVTDPSEGWHETLSHSLGDRHDIAFRWAIDANAQVPGDRASFLLLIGYTQQRH